MTKSWRQFLDIGDRILILVTSCWGRKWPKPSPLSWSCQQHISSQNLTWKRYLDYGLGQASKTRVRRTLGFYVTTGHLLGSTKLFDMFGNFHILSIKTVRYSNSSLKMSWSTSLLLGLFAHKELFGLFGGPCLWSSLTFVDLRLPNSFQLWENSLIKPAKTQFDIL